MTKEPSFYVNQGLTLDCVPSAIAMAVNYNYNVVTGKVTVADVKYTNNNYKPFWSYADAIEGLQSFGFNTHPVDEFDGVGQALIFTKVATGIGHAVYVKDGVVYDSLGLFGKKVYSYEELEIKDYIITFNRSGSNPDVTTRVLHNQ